MAYATKRIILAAVGFIFLTLNLYASITLLQTQVQNWGLYFLLSVSFFAMLVVLCSHLGRSWVYVAATEAKNNDIIQLDDDNEDAFSPEPTVSLDDNDEVV